MIFRRLLFLLCLLLLSGFSEAAAPPTFVYTAPWTPVGKSVSVSASTSSGSSAVQLGWAALSTAPVPPPPTAQVCNTGTVPVYVAFGNSSVSVTTTSTNASYVAASTCANLAIGVDASNNASQYVVAVTASSTATVNVASGVGSQANNGGGSSGGGSNPGGATGSLQYKVNSSTFGGITEVDGSIAYGTGGAWGASSVSAVLDAAFGSTTNDILYRSSGGWAVVAPVTSSYLSIGSGGLLGWSNLPTNGDILTSGVGGQIGGFAPGSGIVTWLGAPSGANLASALTTPLPPSAGGSPYYYGTVTNSGNTYSMTSPTPGGFALINGLLVGVPSWPATNTGASTLNPNSTGATAIEMNTSAGLAALVGGELVSGQPALLQYQSGCTCFVLMTPAVSSVIAGTTQTISALQWANWNVFNTSSASQTLTLPASSGLSGSGGIIIMAEGVSVTLTANAADTLTCTSTGSSGGSLTLQAGSVVAVTKISSGSLGVAGCVGTAAFVNAGTNVATALGTTLSAAGGLTSTIASGTAALGTGAISSGTCASAVTVSAANVATTDVISASFNGDPTGVVGYEPATAGMLTIIGYPTSGNVNFKVCNNTSSSVTPGAITLNWRVTR